MHKVVVILDGCCRLNRILGGKRSDLLVRSGRALLGAPGWDGFHGSAPCRHRPVAPEWERHARGSAQPPSCYSSHTPPVYFIRCLTYLMARSKDRTATITWFHFMSIIPCGLSCFVAQANSWGRAHVASAHALCTCIYVETGILRMLPQQWAAFNTPSQHYVQYSRFQRLLSFPVPKTHRSVASGARRP